MRPSNSVLINAAPGNASITSAPVWSLDIVRASFQFSSTGSAAGTLQVQVSNDHAVGLPPNQYVPTNWSNLGTATTITAGPAVFLISELEMSYEYYRVVYTDTTSGAGTGTITCRTKAMGL